MTRRWRRACGACASSAMSCRARSSRGRHDLGAPFHESHGAAVRVGRAATYTPPRHVVTASARCDLYLDMLEWAYSEAKTRGASDIEEKALRVMVQDEVRRWFEQALSEAVVVLR